MKVLMMFLMVGLIGCDLDTTGEHNRGERIALLGIDSVILIEVYCSPDCTIRESAFYTSSTAEDDHGNSVVYIDAPEHFNASFDAYEVDTGAFIKTISIDSADYEYAEFIFIPNLIKDI